MLLVTDSTEQANPGLIATASTHSASTNTLKLPESYKVKLLQIFIFHSTFTGGISNYFIIIASTVFILIYIANYIRIFAW